MFNRVTLLVVYHVCVDAERDARVTVPQLLLHHCRRCPVCKQGTDSTVPHGMKAASCYSQFRKKWV